MITTSLPRVVPSCIFCVTPPKLHPAARGVSNLGNTCYMNAALQALAHCPELCNALDTESHVLTCPVARRNARRRLEQGREDVSQHPALESHNSRPLTELNSVGGHRRTNSSSSVESKSSKASKKKRTKKDDPQAASEPYGPNFEFCTLCEVERLLARVHNRPEPSACEEPDDCDAGNDSKSITQEDPAALPADGPVVPEPFVSGFMSSVAPWFRKGVQEDSHEFLRLLIDAMQNSCKGARAGCSTADSKDKTISDDGGPSTSSSSSSVQDGEYPFRLFRGTGEFHFCPRSRLPLKVDSPLLLSTCQLSQMSPVPPVEPPPKRLTPLRTSALISYLRNLPRLECHQRV